MLTVLYFVLKLWESICWWGFLVWFCVQQRSRVSCVRTYFICSQCEYVGFENICNTVQWWILRSVPSSRAQYIGPYSSRNAFLRARHSLKCWSWHVLLATGYCTSTLSSECLTAVFPGTLISSGGPSQLLLYPNRTPSDYHFWRCMLDYTFFLEAGHRFLRIWVHWGVWLEGGGIRHASTNSESACKVLLDELICKCFQLSGVLFVTFFMCVGSQVMVADFDNRNVSAFALLCTFVVGSVLLLSNFYKL